MFRAAHPVVFRSHPELIRRQAAFDVETYATYARSGFRWTQQHSLAYEAAGAFANMALANKEQIEDMQALRDAYDSGETSDLFVWLYDRGACWDGLSVVGTHVSEESLVRVFNHRGDWHDWYLLERRDDGERYEDCEDCED